MKWSSKVCGLCCLGLAGSASPPCAAPIALPPEPASFALLSADFDGDGLPDLASVVPDGVSVALNRGEYGFEEPVLTRVRPLTGIGVRGVPAFLAAGDIDGDGRVDLALASQSERCGVDVLLSSGDGRFRSSGRFNVLHAGELYEDDSAYVCTGLVVSDLNHDGRADVVVQHERFSQDFHFGFDVFLADLNGYLDPPVLTTLDGLGPMVSGDMNGDGELDLVIASSGCVRGCWFMTSEVRVEVHLGDGLGGFASPILEPVPVTTESYVLGVAVGQYDADPSLDVAVLDTGGCCTNDGEAVGPQRWLLRGSGGGKLQLGGTMAWPETDQALRRNRLISADVDGDGRDDLAADTATGQVWMEHGRGDGSFAPPRLFASGYVAPARLLLGEDLDGDGRTELVTTAADSGAARVQLLK